MLRPPKSIKPYVRRFCDKVASNERPLYVSVRPVQGAILHDCFGSVSDYVTRYFGEQVIGWAIWEWPKVFIEAEFHAVWRHPARNLVDITPKSVPIPRILFLPDTGAEDVGRYVDNIRQALRCDPAIDRFLEREHLMFLEHSAAEVAEKDGKIPVTEKLRRYEMEQVRLYDRLQKRFGVPTPEAFSARTANAPGLPEP